LTCCAPRVICILQADRNLSWASNILHSLVWPSIPQPSSIDVVWVSTSNHKTRYWVPTNYENRPIYTPRWFSGVVFTYVA
jgi:hypothetical protein